MKVFKKVTSLFLAALLTLSALAVVPFTAAAAENPTPDATWYDANAKTLYIDNLEDLYAMLEVGKADGTDNAPDFAGQTIVLRTDLDMTGLTWEHGGNLDFAGTFDGQGHAIKNFSPVSTAQYGFFDYVRSDGTVKNIAFTNVDAQLKGYSGVIARATGYEGTNGGVLFENVYVGGKVEVGSSSAAGFVGQHGSYAVTFKNCVSEVDFSLASGASGRAAGFIAVGNAGKTATFEDCVVIGDISTVSSHSGGFVAMSTGNTLTVSLTRCVSLVKYNTTSHGAFTSFNGNSTVAYNLVDCYATRTNGRILNSGGVTTGAISVKLGNTNALTIAAGTKLVNNETGIEAYFETNGGYLADNASATWTKDTFATAYPTLANNGWVATGKTVTFADGMTAPEIMPESVADMLTNPATVSYWQVKAGTKENTNDFRFVAKINFADLAAYDEVGYEVTVKVQGGDTLINKQQITTNKVYTSIKAGDDVKLATDLDANYLIALSINGFKNADTTYEVTITPIVKCGTSVIHDADHTVTGTITGNVFTQD